MSHETLASVWSALTDLQDLTAGLRDIVGHSILRSIRSTYHQEETPRRFLEYAHELSLAFDAIRFLSKIGPKSTISLQEDLISAVAHFLNGLANVCLGEQTVLKNNSHRLVLGHTLCSAVAVLRTCAWDCHPELRVVVCKQAGKVLTNSPAKDDSSWLVQTLANLLVAHYGSATPLGQGMDQSKTRWKMLWDDKAQRQLTVQDMVKRATDTNVPSADRIVAMLDLCQLYWDTDSLLIHASMGSIHVLNLDKVFYVPTDSDAVSLALEVRIMVQEQFAVRNMRTAGESDKLHTQSYVMFRPGMRRDCVTDCCSCTLNGRVNDIVSNSRSKQSSLLRSAASAAYNDCAVLGLSYEFFETVHTGYAQRLRRFPGRLDPAQVTGPWADSQEPEPSPPRPCLVSWHSANETSELQRPSEAKARSISQPNIHKRYTRPAMPSSKLSGPSKEPDLSSNAELIDAEVYSKIGDFVEEPQIAELDSTPSDLTTPPSLGYDLCRNGSVTSGTSSSAQSSKDSMAAASRKIGNISEKLMQDRFPEVVHQKSRSSPEDYEKSYPEVLIDPVTAIQEDNMSLFSEGGSMPTTTHSGGRVANQKKWNGIFKGSKRNSTSFAVPTVRFFASGNCLIAFTRYGGACFDVTSSGDVVMHRINAGDIVLAAGGTKRYAIVARFQEAFTLSVFNAQNSEPFFKVSLKTAPKAIDVSKSDAYLAVKYASVVRIFDLQAFKKIDHKLPRTEGSKTIPGGHMVAFANDSLSFMASTRTGPEKVFTYWSWCMDTSKPVVVGSNAPCGNIDDHGLTSLIVAGPSLRGFPCGFLGTFTEKGGPVILAMNEQQPHAIPLRTSRDTVGTRIHGAGIHVDQRTRKSNLVMINHNNDVFWISDLFGRGQDIQRLKTLKRAKSMKPELLIAMSSSEEANIFWVDQKQQCGFLMKIGKTGGTTDPIEIRLDIEPMCAV